MHEESRAPAFYRDGSCIVMFSSVNMLILETISYIERGLFLREVCHVYDQSLVNPNKPWVHGSLDKSRCSVSVACCKRAANNPEALCHCRRGITTILHCSYDEHMRLATLKGLHVGEMYSNVTLNDNQAKIYQITSIILWFIFTC